MMTHMSMTNESMTGESTNRKQQKENTRNNILQAALREFVDKGLANTNVQDVAKAANVSYGTIFAHFPKKDDLLIRVINEYGSQIVEKFNNLVNDDNNLEKILRADLKVIGEYEPFYAQLVSSISRLPSDARNVLIG
ncbi:MAG TPA: TetR/AcrR family transcriptional regulator, partial [Caldisericia bacterium]|nr:TetR/AcrR family transcriptional regulator [Caldisericia bacterium]